MTVAWPKLRLTRPKEMTDIGRKAKEKWARPNDGEDLGPVYIHRSIHVMYCASCGHLNSGGVPSTTEHNNARKSTTSNKSSAPLCCGFNLLLGPLSHCTCHLFSAHRSLAHAITPSSFFRNMHGTVPIRVLLAMSACLVKKSATVPSHRILRYVHGVLNVDEKKLITQFSRKLRDERFELN